MTPRSSGPHPLADGISENHKHVALFMVVLLETLIADSVAESNIGIISYIGFELVPISLVVTDALAMHTNRQNAP